MDFVYYYYVRAQHAWSRPVTVHGPAVNSKRNSAQKENINIVGNKLFTLNQGWCKIEIEKEHEHNLILPLYCFMESAA